MGFEERILLELKAEIAAQAARRRRARAARRLVAGAAVTGLAAAAAVGVPLLTGTEPPAYALSRNPDGSIRVQINEFRDPGRLEADLARHGVSADVTYLEPGHHLRGTPDRRRARPPGEGTAARAARGVGRLPRRRRGENRPDRTATPPAGPDRRPEARRGPELGRARLDRGRRPRPEVRRGRGRGTRSPGRPRRLSGSPACGDPA